MVAAGIRSILNFAPAAISVPTGVSVRKVDLSIELQILAYYEQRKAALADVRQGGGAVNSRRPAESRPLLRDRDPEDEQDGQDHHPEEDELDASLIEEGSFGADHAPTSSRISPISSCGSVPGRGRPAGEEVLALRSAMSSSGRWIPNKMIEPARNM